MRVLLIGGGHSAYFAARAIREIDPDGHLVIIEFTREKVEMLSRTFPSAEVLFQEIDRVEDYIKENSELLDAVIAATESDSLNLRYCRVARENAVPITVGILNNPLNYEIFKKEKINYIIDPYRVITIQLFEILGAPVNVIFSSLVNNLEIASVRILNEKLLHELRSALDKHDDVIAAFVSRTGEIGSSPSSVSLGGSAYIMGPREKIEKLLQLSRNMVMR